MKPACGVRFLEAGGKVFGLFLGANGWAEHGWEPKELHWSLKCSERHPGAMCGDAKVIQEMLMFAHSERRGTPVAGLGLNRLGQYRKSSSWMKAQIKYLMPSGWPEKAPLSFASGSDDPCSTVGLWDNRDFIVFAAGDEAIRKLEALAQDFVMGDLCIAKDVHFEGSTAGGGLALSVLSKAPAGWLEGIEDGNLMRTDLKAWIERKKSKGG